LQELLSPIFQEIVLFYTTFDLSAIKMLAKSILIISMLTAALLLPLAFDNTVQAIFCMTPDSPLGNLAKNFLDIPIIKQGIQKKMAENPGNKTFLKVINEASKNMTSLLCKPGEVATIFNASAPLYFPASNNTTNSTSSESNSTLTTAVQQPQIKKNDSISFKATLELPPYPSSTTFFGIPPKSNFTFGSGSPICPTNDCKQEFITAAYNAFDPQSPLVTGTLKIENNTTSTPQTIKYNLIRFQGNFHVTGIEEDRKTGNNVIALSGDFGFGSITSTGPQINYNVTGTFDNATKVLNFEGERSTS
jgi:hypothetical protein